MPQHVPADHPEHQDTCHRGELAGQQQSHQPEAVDSAALVVTLLAQVTGQVAEHRAAGAQQVRQVAQREGRQGGERQQEQAGARTAGQHAGERGGQRDPRHQLGGGRQPQQRARQGCPPPVRCAPGRQQAAEQQQCAQGVHVRVVDRPDHHPRTPAPQRDPPTLLP
ncbi:hypothetical protein ASE03_24860 [Kitasatospora sp. Root187]|nr:hypothetical protein ASC99_21700 [Kitasatospora sp. Root107]KRB71248.1 hypothetical protein ASE03_24860 [Kitasatospora sp. Root187]